MKLINQTFFIMYITEDPMQLIEKAGRTCYKSEDKITPYSAEKFVGMLHDHGHHSVLEHATMTIKFITNRGVTHELVRHRLASFSQESTRYVNYGGEDIEFIKPVWMDIEVGTYNQEIDPRLGGNLRTITFMHSMMDSEWDYKRLLELGWRPEQAREVLPNALKTEIVVTANMREWRHIFKLRTSPKAHPQIRALMLDTLEEVKRLVPVLFDDLGGE